MKIPKNIFANVGFDPLDGIINKIKKYSSNPIDDNLVVPSAVTSKFGVCNSTVTWDGNFATNDGNPYLTIRFPDRYLFPTHYTIRGTSVNYEFQKTWDVHGYNKGEDDDSSKWTLLASNESTFDTFCSNGANCITTKRSTVFSMIPTKKGFEYIRFTATSTLGSVIHFTTSGIEFFGSLSVYNKMPIYRCHESIQCKSSFRYYFVLFNIISITPS